MGCLTVAREADPEVVPADANKRCPANGVPMAPAEEMGPPPQLAHPECIQATHGGQGLYRRL